MYVFLVKSHTKSAVQIGVTKDIENQVDIMSARRPFELTVEAAIWCKSRVQADNIKMRLHVLLSDFALGGGWFSDKFLSTRLMQKEILRKYRKRLVENPSSRKANKDVLLEQMRHMNAIMDE